MTSDSTNAAEPQVPEAKYPKSIPYIIGNEAAERFSFYGMRSILVTFLVIQFFNPTADPALQTVAQAKANEQTHFFVSLAYTMPFLGAIAADWFFGKYKVILYVSIIYCIGHLFLAVFEKDLEWFKYGLLLIAIGAGGIKSCVSANVGDQFDKTNQSLLSKVYGWFYFSINAGSMIATVAIPWVYAHIGPKWAFGIPGILMGLATLIFFLGRHQYVRVPPSGIKRDNFVFISFYALTHIGKKKAGQSWLDVAKGAFKPERVEGVKAVYRVMSVFAFAIIFWALWDQNLSEWVLQAEQLNRHINLGFVEFTVLPGQVQTANPVFLLSFIPLFNYVIYPFFNRIGLKATPLRRIGTGLALTALSFLVIALLQERIDVGESPSIWWQIFAYVLLSAGEVMVSITGLEYAYTQSPISMKSTMTAIWLLTVAAGNLLVAFINSSIAEGGMFTWLHGATYYWFFMSLMVITFLLFLIVSPRLKERSYIDEPDDEPEAASSIN